MKHPSEAVVIALWKAMDDRDWDRAGALLDEDVVVDWPHSRERFRGRAAFVAMNRAYPGAWRITVRRVARIGDEVLTVVSVADGAAEHHAVSFFEVREGRVRAALEYWSSPEDPPGWRTAGGWAERY